MALRSWSCKGCTNLCYRLVHGEVVTYCRPAIEKGKNRTAWVTDEYIACLDYTTDPAATDPIPKIHEDYYKEV